MEQWEREALDELLDRLPPLVSGDVVEQRRQVARRLCQTRDAQERVDHAPRDPVGAISVHGVGGLFGMLCVGIFADGTYGSGWNGTGNAVAAPVGHGVQGIIKGDWGQLGAQAIGFLTLIAVMFGMAFAFFFIQNKLTKGGIRSDELDEMVGLDLPETFVFAYPEFDLVKDDLTKKSESKVPASV